ncbi:hypothetical protein DFH11DRAFT_1619702 [Phellopilus nigrolimitatus]|nr:hypothetical protein DFH11DRAFT_1619702 [Phellopilus nigrolimitatus]
MVGRTAGPGACARGRAGVYLLFGLWSVWCGVGGGWLRSCLPGQCQVIAADLGRATRAQRRSSNFVQNFPKYMFEKVRIETIHIV